MLVCFINPELHRSNLTTVQPRRNCHSKKELFSFWLCPKLFRELLPLPCKMLPEVLKFIRESDEKGTQQLNKILNPDFSTKPIFPNLTPSHPRRYPSGPHRHRTNGTGKRQFPPGPSAGRRSPLRISINSARPHQTTGSVGWTVRAPQFRLAATSTHHSSPKARRPSR